MPGMIEKTGQEGPTSARSLSSLERAIDANEGDVFYINPRILRLIVTELSVLKFGTPPKQAYAEVLERYTSTP